MSSKTHQSLLRSSPSPVLRSWDMVLIGRFLCYWAPDRLISHSLLSSPASWSTSSKRPPGYFWALRCGKHLQFQAPCISGYMYIVWYKLIHPFKYIYIYTLYLRQLQVTWKRRQVVPRRSKRTCGATQVFLQPPAPHRISQLRSASNSLYLCSLRTWYAKIICI